MSDIVEARTRILSLLEGDAKSKTWIRRHLDHQDADFCLIWPFAWKEGGYPGFGKPWTTVHRLMCEYRHGPPPTPQHHSAHSCGRGTLGCVNGCHVSWKTPSENQFDRRRHAPDPRRRKLNHDEVDEIRALANTERTSDLAQRFGVSIANIKLIQAGKTWRKDRCDSRVFTPAEIIRVRSKEQTARALAEEFGVSMSVIHRIRTRATFAYIEDPAFTSEQKP